MEGASSTRFRRATSFMTAAALAFQDSGAWLLGKGQLSLGLGLGSLPWGQHTVQPCPVILDRPGLLPALPLAPRRLALDPDRGLGHLPVQRLLGIKLAKFTVLRRGGGAGVKI